MRDDGGRECQNYQNMRDVNYERPQVQVSLVTRGVYSEYTFLSFWTANETENEKFNIDITNLMMISSKRFFFNRK
jgi:hypothetical protein